jgi:hypothetical protein
MADHLAAGRIRVDVDQVGFADFEKAWIAQGSGTSRKQVLVPAA